MRRSMNCDQAFSPEPLYHAAVLLARAESAMSRTAPLGLRTRNVDCAPSPERIVKAIVGHSVKPVIATPLIASTSERSPTPRAPASGEKPFTTRHVADAAPAGGKMRMP